MLAMNCLVDLYEFIRMGMETPTNFGALNIAFIVVIVLFAVIISRVFKD